MPGKHQQNSRRVPCLHDNTKFASIPGIATGVLAAVAICILAGYVLLSRVQSTGGGAGAWPPLASPPKVFPIAI